MSSSTTVGKREILRSEQREMGRPVSNIVIRVIKITPEGERVIFEAPVNGKVLEEHNNNIVDELARIANETGGAAIVNEKGEVLETVRPSLKEALIKKPLARLKYGLMGVSGDLDNVLLKLLSKTKVINITGRGASINAGILGSKQWRAFIQAYRDRYGQEYSPGEILWTVIPEVLNRNCTMVQSTGSGERGTVSLYRCIAPDGKEFYTVLEMVKNKEKGAYTNMIIRSYDKYPAARVEYMRAGTILAPSKVRRYVAPTTLASTTTTISWKKLLDELLKSKGGAIIVTGKT